MSNQATDCKFGTCQSVEELERSAATGNNKYMLWFQM